MNAIVYSFFYNLMTKIADMSLLFFYSYDCIRYSSGDIADAIYELRL